MGLTYVALSPPALRLSARVMSLGLPPQVIQPKLPGLVPWESSMTRDPGAALDNCVAGNAIGKRSQLSPRTAPGLIVRVSEIKRVTNPQTLALCFPALNPCSIHPTPHPVISDYQ